MGPGRGGDKDDDAVNNSNQRDNNKRNNRPNPTDSVVRLVVKYDGLEQDVANHPTRTQEYTVTEPRGVKEVTLELTNTSDERVGVVLAVNGLNTLYQENLEETPPASCSKWVLKPHVTYRITGYYEKGDTSVKPFRILSKEESKAKEENDPAKMLGAIQMIVFAEGSGGNGNDEANRMGLRKPLKKYKEKKRPRSAREARERVSKAMRRDRQGLIDADEVSRDTQLNTVKFKASDEIENRAIWYRERGSGGGNN
jgi:hypothetical protein